MNIAFVSTMSAAPWGGSEELWSRAAEAALREHHTVLASVTEWHELDERLVRLEQQQMVIHLRKLYSANITTRVLRRVQSKVGLIMPLEKAITSFGPRFVCISQGGSYDIMHMRWLRDYLINNNIVFYIVCHNYNPNHHPTDAERGIVVDIYQRAKRVFFVSNEQCTVIQRQLAHRIANAEIVRNPVNILNKVQLPWPISAIPQLAMVAGLYIERKGHDIVLEILSQEKWVARSWHLNLYGDGPDKNYIKALIGMYDLGARVTVHGNVADIESIWRKNHLLLLPSRLEAAPLVIMEAMLCGRPVVATAVGTVAEWVEDGYNGFIAPAATSQLYEAALEQAWATQEQWPEMGSRAQRWAQQNNDPDAGNTFLYRMIQLLDNDIELNQLGQTQPVGFQ